MSLDVYLKMETPVEKNGSGIFIRENGQTIEISRKEWDERFPDSEPIIMKHEPTTHYVFDYNIIHNLGAMAEKAEIYQYLWRPEELNITQAKDLIESLKEGLSKLLDDHSYYKQFNPENGWGNYEGLLNFVSAYLSACIEYPESVISVSR